MTRLMPACVCEAKVCSGFRQNTVYHHQSARSREPCAARAGQGLTHCSRGSENSRNGKRIHACSAMSESIVLAVTNNTCELDHSGSGASSSDQTSGQASTSGSTSAGTLEMCVIVDEQDNVVGAATRYDTVSKRLLGRGAYVLVFNSAGELFVSKRSEAKDCYPGCLDVTVSGVVNQGEEYSDTAARELQEEVGIPVQHSKIQLQQLFIFPYQDNVCHVWGCAFATIWDGCMVFRDAEVEWGRFMRLEQLSGQLLQQPERFTPVGRHILRLYLQKRQQGQRQQQQQQQELQHR